MKLYGYMLKSGFLGVVFLQNLMLGMYVVMDLECVYQLFDEMCERDVIFWSLMIGVYVKNEELLLVLQMFKVMWDRVELDGLIMVSIFRVCGNFVDVNMGRFFYGYVIFRGYGSDVFVLNFLIDLYFRCNDLIFVLRVFNEMGVKNIVLWNLILLGLVYNGMYLEVVSLVNFMVEVNVEIDEVIIVNFF